MPSYAAAYLSPIGTHMLVSFTSTEGFVVSQRFKDFLEALRSELSAALSDAGGAVRGLATGGLVVTADSTSAILQDVALSDGITVSMSFLLLAAALRSLRLIAVAFASLVAAFGGAFLLAWPLTTAMNVPNFTTSLLISTLVSLSLDYSLFLLSHLKGSLRRGVQMERAVEEMLRSSGHTVLVSGATLAACFLVLGTQPVAIVRAPGIATTFAVFFSVAANLTLTPALLLLFPRFCAGPATATEGAPACCSHAGGYVARRVAAAERGTRRLWTRIAWMTQTHKYGVTVFLFALLVVPFAPHLQYFSVSQNTKSIVPRGEPSVVALYDMLDVFGPSRVTPASLLGVAKAPLNALSAEFFTSAAAAVTAVLSVSASSGALAASDVRGLAWPNGNASAVAAAVSATSSCPADTAAACCAVCSADACALRLQATRTLSSPDGRAMLISLAVRISLNSDDGVAWARDVRAALAPVNAGSPNIEWFLLVEPAPETIAYVFEHFPELLGITVAVIFVILLVAFRSPAISLRAVVTLCAMEIAVFGSATAIYCRGYLGHGGVLETFNGDVGLMWVTTILAFSLITGLGLDYDIFILTSIVEEREAGWSDSDAISVGLQRSGPIISWAGAIMMVAYGGFLFSSIPLLNQLGFFLVWGIFLDTFLVRPLLVPAVMHILGRANYWPRAMPVPTRGPLDLLAPPPAEEEEEEEEYVKAAVMDAYAAPAKQEEMGAV